MREKKAWWQGAVWILARQSWPYGKTPFCHQMSRKGAKPVPARIIKTNGPPRNGKGRYKDIYEEESYRAHRPM
jgi:hypothetical protein